MKPGQLSSSRKKWLGKPLELRTARKLKSMRFNFTNPKTNIGVNFYRKGDNKSQVVVQQDKLASQNEATRMKTYWNETLDYLKSVLIS